LVVGIIALRRWLASGKLEEMFTELLPDWVAHYGLVEIDESRDLSRERLLHGYRTGMFPWNDEDMPVCWWSPDPRAVFDLDKFRATRRLWRTYRSPRFQLTVNRAFGQVIRGCASRPGEGTWITSAMIDAYERMHELGHAHSVEAWQDGQLAGGIYGVAVGGLFAGESMFFRRRDASKVALLHLVLRLRERGFVLFDTQFVTEHTARLGAIEIPREEYLRRLRWAIGLPVAFT
jgi:leucyl/phenylalanyl-tRNA--protein transferase